MGNLGEELMFHQRISFPKKKIGNEKYHEECLTPDLRALAIEQGELG